MVALLDMGVLLWFIAPPLDYWLAADTGARALALLAWIAAGAAVYFISLLILGLRPRHLRGS